MSNSIHDPGVPIEELPNKLLGDLNDFSMLHMNGHLLCAVDVETTGREVGTHDIVEIAIVPLNHLIEPYKKYRPFHMKLKPKRPENVDNRALGKSGLKLADLILDGFDPWKAADYLEEWFNRLNLPIRHNLVPLAHNWPFDRDFIKEWLGPLTFEYIFHGHYRDTMQIASFLNDRAYDKKEPYVYAKIGLEALCLRMGIENKMPHRALYDCLATAEIYKKFVTQFSI